MGHATGLCGVAEQLEARRRRFHDMAMDFPALAGTIYKLAIDLRFIVLRHVCSCQSCRHLMEATRDRREAEAYEMPFLDCDPVSPFGCFIGNLILADDGDSFTSGAGFWEHAARCETCSASVSVVLACIEAQA